MTAVPQTSIPTPTSRFERADFRWIILILVAGLLAHGMSLTGGFVWDDVFFLDVWLPRFDTLKRIFFPPPNIEYWPPSYYRPLGVLSLRIDYRLYGLNPIGWHATNLVLHCIVCAQVFLLLNRLLITHAHRVWLRNATAMLFAVHPVHVESVNWIAGRSDPLAAICILGVLLSALHYLQRPHWIWLSLIGILQFFGLLFKENAITSIPLLVLCAIWLKQQSDSSISFKNRHFVLAIATMILAVACYAALRLSASTGSGDTSHALTVQSLVTVIRAVAYYMLQFFLIKPQVIGPPIDFAPAVGYALILLIGVVISMIVSSRRSHKLITITNLGLMLFFISISPSLLVPAFDLDTMVIYERYLYLPSLGLCLVVVFLIHVLTERFRFPQRGEWLIGVLCALCIVKANLYGRHWKDNLVIWEHNLTLVPDHTMAWTMLGLEYLRQERPRERLHACMEAVRVTPENNRLYYGLLVNLAVAAREVGNYDLSESVARRGIMLNENGAEAWIELGLSKLHRDDRSTAEDCFKRALEIKPVSPEARVNLAYLKPDGSAEQQELLESAIALDPFNAMAFNNLGILYAGKKDKEKAIMCFEEAARLDPRLKMARENLKIMRGN